MFIRPHADPVDLTAADALNEITVASHQLHPVRLRRLCEIAVTLGATWADINAAARDGRPDVGAARHHPPPARRTA